MIEIERKFLVKNELFKQQAVKQHLIKQGYLNSAPERTVRIRIKGNQGFLTFKGLGDDSGTTRFELEKEISVAEAEALMNLCEKGIIHKIRWEIPAGKHTFEVDEFFGDNAGLVIAEIELENQNEPFLIPDWLGPEVTSDSRYYNAYLSKIPFNNW
jgi:adenylate cyclase